MPNTAQYYYSKAEKDWWINLARVNRPTQISQFSFQRDDSVCPTCATTIRDLDVKFRLTGTE